MDYEDEINLIDYWRVLVRYKGFLAKIAGAAFACSIVVSLLLPKIYAAKTSLFPPQQDTMNPLLELGNNLPMAGLLGGMAGLKTPADVWVGILKSHTVLDALINRFGLKALYDQGTQEETRRALEKHVKIQKGKEGIIAITVEDRDPKRAAAMANAFVEELDRINKREGISSGRRTRIFVGKRLAVAKRAMEKAEEAVKTFLEKNKAIKLDDQSKAILRAVGDVKGALMAKEVELETLLSFATPSHPQVEILRAELKGLQDKMRELSEGNAGNPTGNPKGSDIFIPTAKMPNVGLQYVRLVREATIQETLFTFLTKQYEMARIQEAKDSPTVQVLDIATLPEKKVKPKRASIVILSTVTALFLGVLIAFLKESLEKGKNRNLEPKTLAPSP